MHTNTLKLMAVALALVVAGSTVAEAGGPANPIEAVAEIVHKSPDFDGTLDPTPKPVINKVIDVSKPTPTIYKKLDLFPSQPSPGGFVTYREAARLNIGLKLNCLVAGTPSEFPDDLFIANTGLVNVPAGTKVRWEIASLGLEGVALLQGTLKAGKSIGLRGVINGGAEAGTPCAITAIGL